MLELWDIIRDFFVRYIFGGYDSIGDYFYGNLGSLLTAGSEDISGSFNPTQSTTVYVGIPNLYFDDTGANPFTNTLFMSFSDWLSTTATIIVLTLICVAIGLAVVWLFKEVYRMITKWAL